MRVALDAHVDGVDVRAVLSQEPVLARQNALAHIKRRSLQHRFLSQGQTRNRQAARDGNTALVVDSSPAGSISLSLSLPRPPTPQTSFQEEPPPPPPRTVSGFTFGVDVFC